MNIYLQLIITGALLLLIIPAVKMQIVETKKPAIGPYYHQQVISSKTKRKRKNKRWGK